MTLFEFLTTAAEARVVATKLGRFAPERLLQFVMVVVMIMVAIGTMYVFVFGLSVFLHERSLLSGCLFAWLRKNGSILVDVAVVEFAQVGF